MPTWLEVNRFRPQPRPEVNLRVGCMDRVEPAIVMYLILLPLHVLDRTHPIPHPAPPCHTGAPYSVPPYATLNYPTRPYPTSWDMGRSGWGVG